MLERTFLVQNSVLNNKLLNSFFVIIMYFFCHENFKADSGFPLPHQLQHPCKNQPISSVQTQKISENPKDRVSLNDKLPNEKHYKMGCGGSENQYQLLQDIFEGYINHLCQITFINSHCKVEFGSGRTNCSLQGP